MHVAVTGASGQLGSHVLRRLVDDPSVQSVVSLDLRPPRVSGAKLRHVEADVREPDFARHLVRCDALVHLAFVVIRKLPRAQFDDINVRGSENVFGAAAHAGLRQIVYTSSVAAYGVVDGHPRPLTEDAPRVRQADFAYACAKYDVESFLDRFEGLHPDLPVARLRPGVLIGARMDHPGSRALRNRLLFDVGGGPSPLVWDEDVADAVMLALHRRARGAFNVVADDPRTARELARAAGFRYVFLPSTVLRAGVRAGPLVERLGLGEAMDPAWMSVSTDMQVSSAKARATLGWNPTCPTAIDVMRRFEQTAPQRLDPRIALFVRLAHGASGALSTGPLRSTRAQYHLALTGRTGGDLTVAVDHGHVSVRTGLPRPPDASITLPARALVELLAGRTDPGSLAKRGLLEVHGDPNAEHALGALVQRFREAA
ncbi:MAG: NAD-dependent epimerase/dehydratase family protein, partial [Deltaproteobacteria bacterium]